MKKASLILLIFLTSLTVFGQDISGQWNGILKVQGTQLRVVFNISKTDNGYRSTMDSPDQGAKEIPVTTTSFDNSVLKLAVTNSRIEYEGTLNKDNNIIGNFKQAGQSFPMDLSKVKTEKEKAVIASENKDTNFMETQIILKTKSGDIFGTLTTPKSFSNISVALIIAGSGPTDRDCNNPMMKCDAYKKLAYGLSENNIASLRYDKRGIAESKAAGKSETDLRFDDYVNDAKEWIQLLKQDKRFSKVIVIGHSEGSLIGMIASTIADKFISIAGAGQSADKTIKEQLSTQPKEVQDLSYPILDSLVKGKTADNVNPVLNSLFRKSVQPYMISWFKYDPQIEIQKLNMPILIVQGTNDIQVTVEDAKRLSKANPKSQLVLIEKMNHIFRTVDGDKKANVATYNNSSLPLADGFIKNITSFILKN
ncbi:alpha/beta hydrolase [Flavobacterium algicola]|uniref:alpha/beta hydrolase n=1 Tax=Flavobacterium algicola TaxID=556529 RepID=UPI001EFE204D|nr:alpha/beta hydrolase [Flavobacterium algicola]MCG9792628.1 alpha/beta hydrolase [Flavobacterium algicola]